MNRIQVLEKLKSLKEKKQRLMVRQAREKAENQIYFFEPLASSRRPWLAYQQRILDFFHDGRKIVIWPGPNKLGKTGLASVIMHSWALGYEPWRRVWEGHPQAFRAPDGKHYHRSSLGIDPPVRIRITGEDWEHHLGEVVVPELKKWAPPLYETKKNNMGVEAHWTWKNGSTFELMTHAQDKKLFESWLGDGWWPDEPPPQHVFSGMSRGLFTTGGKTLLTMTPLSMPWILDELILSGRPDVGVLDDVNIWDMPYLFDHDSAVLTELGLTDEEIEEFTKLHMRWAWEGNEGEPPGILTQKAA